MVSAWPESGLGKLHVMISDADRRGARIIWDFHQLRHQPHRCDALEPNREDVLGAAAVPAGVLAQAWRGGARQARVARLLRASVTTVVSLDRGAALRTGALCAAAGTSDVVDASVAVCAQERGHAVVTTDPGDLRALDPALRLLTP